MRHFFPNGSLIHHSIWLNSVQIELEVVMDIDFAPEDQAFRNEVRSFIEENYPKHLVGVDRGELSREDFLA